MLKHCKCWTDTNNAIYFCSCFLTLVTRFSLVRLTVSWHAFVLHDLKSILFFTLSHSLLWNTYNNLMAARRRFKSIYYIPFRQSETVCSTYIVHTMICAREKDWTRFTCTAWNVSSVARTWEMDNGIIQHKAAAADDYDDNNNNNQSIWIFIWKLPQFESTEKGRICCQAIKSVWKCVYEREQTRTKRTHTKTYINWILLNQFRIYGCYYCYYYVWIIVYVPFLCTGQWLISWEMNSIEWTVGWLDRINSNQ